MVSTCAPQAFSGNSNSESAVRHELQQGIVARFLRLVPLDWSEEGRIGLRIEVYGCSYCESHAHGCPQTHDRSPPRIWELVLFSPSRASTPGTGRSLPLCWLAEISLFPANRMRE